MKATVKGIVLAITIAITVGSFTLISQNRVSNEEKLKAKKEHLLRVLNRLWSTIRYIISPPEIIVLDRPINFFDPYSIACYQPGSATIYFGSEFYDLCMKIGEEALAAVLGHELGHYVCSHTEHIPLNGYILSQVDSSIINKTLKNDEFTIYKGLETQADIFSGLHCYAAGYDISDAYEMILDSIYARSNFYEPSNEKYPYLPLEDRKKLIREAKNSLRELIPLFDAAFHLTLLGEYEKAGDCFKFFIEEKELFPNFELCNNAGVCYALEYLTYIHKNPDGLIYPLELEADTILQRIVERKEFVASRAIASENKQLSEYKAKYLLSESKRLLNEALKMNKKSLPTLLNLACICAIDGDYTGARTFALKAKDLASQQKLQNYIQNAEIILGIIAYLQKDSAKADTHFVSASRSSPLASYNLNILRMKQKPMVELTTTGSAGRSGSEKISNIPLRDFENKLHKQESYSYSYKDLNLKLLTYKEPNITGQKIVLNGNKEIKILKTPDNYKGETAMGIKVGAPSSLVQNKYGLPSRAIVTSGFVYWIYDNLGLIFKFELGYVSGWLLFAKKEL